MNDLMLLVDLENIQRFDLGKAPPNACIKVFVGESQSKLPTDLVQQALALGSRFEWVRIDGNGKNALDFHIACHLGEGIARTPQAEFVIVSRDTGFDPLLRHLKARGLHGQREAPAEAVRVASKLVLDAKVQHVVEVLMRTEKNKRPRKRKTLTNHLVN